MPRRLSIDAPSPLAGFPLATMTAKALLGHTFYDFDGDAVKDPIDTLAGAGVDAFRVQAFLEQCIVPEPFAPSASPMDDEDDFLLGFGCIDVKVEIAQQAVAPGDEDAAYHQPGSQYPQRDGDIHLRTDGPGTTEEEDQATAAAVLGRWYLA
ncbi:MAG: hypothetical protein Q9180_000273 [Flavoplaca navasiana]